MQATRASADVHIADALLFESLRGGSVILSSSLVEFVSESSLVAGAILIEYDEIILGLFEGLSENGVLPCEILLY